MSKTKQPNAEQLAALNAFAVKYGTGWKVKLFDKWMNGSDANEPDGHLLRQVRNQFGPKWLAKFALDPNERLNQAALDATAGSSLRLGRPK